MPAGTGFSFFNMAKDPAFLFYPGDWLMGTMGMTFYEKGAYMELLVYQFNRDAFKENIAINMIGADAWEVLKDKFILDESGKFYNKRLREEKEKRKAYTESRRKARTKKDTDEVRLYVVRDNVRLTYKIGTSVNPLRRYNELCNQKSPAIMETENAVERDLTLIWYSDPIERKVESVVHEHLSSKRIKGEWFNLTKKDINYLTKTYGGKLRTLERTENENENEDRDISKDKDSDIVYPYESENFKKMWGQWMEYKRTEFNFKFKSQQSQQAALTKLANLANNEDDAIKIIMQSMAEGWKGLFKIKTNGKTKEAGHNETMRILQEQGFFND